MGYFNSQRETKQITLPSNNDYWVKVLAGLRYGDIKHLAKTSENGEVDFTSTADQVLLTIIQEWNLDGEDGAVVEITPEAIDQLTQSDVMAILSEVKGLSTEGEAEKKTSSGK